MGVYSLLGLFYPFLFLRFYVRAMFRNKFVRGLFLQNKEFVCRGYDYERLEDFQQRMLGEFPQAIAMQHPNQPDDTILQSDAQCIPPPAVSFLLIPLVVNPPV